MTFIVLNIIPFMRYLSSLFLFFLLVSCKSLSPTTIASAASMASTTIHTRDTIFLRDSIFISERQRGDTVYLTRVEYRDRWRTRVERDTVVDVRVEKEEVQLPPERYVPKFYRWCTIALWAIGLSVIGYWLLKRLGLARFLYRV